MIAFFDTCIHVDILRGRRTVDTVLAQVRGGPVRISPVVASELLRGSTSRARRAVERLVTGLVPVEPPSWRACWIEAGRLLPEVFRDHEEIGLASLQNDALLALTARHTGTTLVTRDRHFESLARKVSFRLIVLE